LGVKSHTGMKYYTPQHKQLTLDLVRSSLDNLDKSNRWVQMGDLLPWADIEKEYNSRLDNKEKGAGNKPARMVIGATVWSTIFPLPVNYDSLPTRKTRSRSSTPRSV